MSARPPLPVRLGHALLHRHEYRPVQRGAGMEELCYSRRTGELVGEKWSPPGDAPYFRRVVRSHRRQKAGA